MIRRIRTFVPVLAQALVVATLLGIAMPVHAEIIVNSVNMFRDFRGPNDVGVTTTRHPMFFCRKLMTMAHSSSRSGRSGRTA